MRDLFETAVAAHGGLGRWNHVKSITVDASITGAIWYAKNQGDALNDIRLEVDTTRPRLAVDFVGRDKRSVFEPHRVDMQRSDGGNSSTPATSRRNRLTGARATRPFVSPMSQEKIVMRTGAVRIGFYRLGHDD